MFIGKIIEAFKVWVLLSFLVSIFFFSNLAYTQTPDSTQIPAKDMDHSCKPSLPIEIVATSIFCGIPAYWGWRGLFDYDPKQSYSFNAILIPPSLFLLMLSLGPIAEWTSGCEAFVVAYPLD